MAYVYQDQNPLTGDPYPKWRFQYVDRHGKKRTQTGTESEKKTRKLAKDIEDRERLIRNRLAAPAQHEALLDDFEFEPKSKEYIEWGIAQGGLQGFGWAKMHSANRRRYLAWWKTELNLRRLSDITLPRIEAELRRLLRRKLAPKTVQGYAECISAFCDWCVDRKYLAADPLTGLRAIKGERKEMHRELTAEELKALFRVAPPRRALWYEVSLSTGYRLSECHALRVRDLDRFGPSLPLAAAFCKNRKQAQQPIDRELCAKLVASIEGKKPEDSLLDMPKPHTAGAFLQDDFTAAGVAPFIKGQGKATFHSFRVNYINGVVASGADLKTILELSRHSAASMSLETYAKPNQQRIRKAAEAAPKLAMTVDDSLEVAEKKTAGAEGEIVSVREESGCAVSEVNYPARIRT